MSSIRHYPFGFIISDIFLDNLPDHFKTIHLKDYYYSFDDKHQGMIYRKNNSFLIIHGHFVDVHPDESIDNNDLAEVLLDQFLQNYNAFLTTLDYIAGRYVIIVCDNNDIYVFQDAAGTRSVYYALTQNVASSHAHLIADNINTQNDPLTEHLTRLPKVSVRTPFSNIKSMIPNHHLSLHSKTLTRFFPRNENSHTNKSDQERFNRIQQMWQKQLAFYTTEYDNVIHSITGGYDSRASLAMSRNFFGRLKFFTYALSEQTIRKKNAFNIRYEEDKIIVKQFIDQLPVEHQFFYIIDNMKPVSEALNKALDKNTVTEHGRKIIPHYLEFTNDPNTIHVRGNVNAISKSPYIQSNLMQSRHTLIKRHLKQLQIDHNDSHYQKVVKVLEEDIENIGYGNEIHGYHPLDLAYWEIRIGRFQSEIFNESDVAFDTLNPFNVRALIDISLSFDLLKRKEEYIPNELINRNLPLLNFYGKNNVLNLYEQGKSEHKEKIDAPVTSFDSFNTFDAANKTTVNIPTKNDMIYIPLRYINKASFSEIKLTYSKAKGILKLTVSNKYSSSRGHGYMQYEIYKNNQKILEEDIAYWKYDNEILIFNLTKGDIISLRMKALKTVMNKSWEKASKMHLKHYSEWSTDMTFNTPVKFLSPFSKKI